MKKIIAFALAAIVAGIIVGCAPAEPAAGTTGGAAATAGAEKPAEGAK